MCETRTQTAEGEGGTEDDGVADFGGGVECGLDCRDGGGLGGGNLDFWLLVLWVPDVGGGREVQEEGWGGWGVAKVRGLRACWTRLVS